MFRRDPVPLLPFRCSLNQYGETTNGTQHEIGGYDGVTYRYLADTYLASVSSTAAGTYELGYDALGRCVKRSTNGQSTYFAFAGDRPIIEYNSSGAITASSVYGLGIDEIIARNNNGQAQFLHQDRLGNTSAVTNIAGEVIEQYRYDAFGTPAIRSGPTPGSGPAPANWLGTLLSATQINNRFLFTGREWVRQFGFYEYRARAYHPGLGRFMSEDPVGFKSGDRNLFRYCGGDPVNRVDPDGLRPTGGDPNVSRPTLPPIQPDGVVSNITVEFQKLRTVIGSNIPQWVTVLKGVADANLKAAFTGLVKAAVGDPIPGKRGKTSGDHVDRTQSIYTDGSLSEVSKAFHGKHWGSGGLVRDKFFTEIIPHDKPVGFLLHFHNDLQNVSTANPSGKDAAAVKSWQAPMLFSSESLYRRNEGVLLRPNGSYEPTQIPVLLNW